MLNGKLLKMSATNKCKRNDEIRKKSLFCNHDSNDWFSCESLVDPKYPKGLVNIRIFIFSWVLSYQL